MDRYTAFDHSMYCYGYDLDEIEQRVIAARDVNLLKTGCRAIQAKYPQCKYELMVADDCTISVRVRHGDFDCYFIPSMPDEPPAFVINIDSPVEKDFVCHDATALVDKIGNAISGSENDTSEV